MKKRIKDYLRNYRFFTVMKHTREVLSRCRRMDGNIFDYFRKYPVIFSEDSPAISLCRRKAMAYEKLLAKMEPSVRPADLLAGRRTVFSFPYYRRGKESAIMPFGNLTPDYALVLKKGIDGIAAGVVASLARCDDSAEKEFLGAVVSVCKASTKHALRYADAVEKLAAKADGKDRARLLHLAVMCRKVPAKPAESFYEALQSVYFINLLLWAEGHSLVGVGRLDQYLWPYYEADLKAGKICADEARTYVREFWQRLSEDMSEKSNTLRGDTGQSVVLGGIDPVSGKDAANELTFIIMDVARECRQIDPKVVLRVHAGTSERLWRASIDLLKTGVGYPLYASDDVIVPALASFGYEPGDARNYAVSACWEPLIPGKSFDLNNVGAIHFLKVLEAALNSGLSLVDGQRIGPDMGALEDCDSFEMFVDKVKRQMSAAIEETVRRCNAVEYEPAPLLSALTAGCLEKHRDISNGGAVYNNYGLLNNGFADMVNSLEAVRKLVFEQGKVQKNELVAILQGNFKGNGTLREFMRSRVAKFGNDDAETDALAAALAVFYGEESARQRNRFGGRYKAGLGTAGGYVYGANETGASPDGRLAGETLADNFSPAPGTEKNGITAVVNSVGHTDFNKVFNGSVLDLKLSPAILTTDGDTDRFLTLLKVIARKCEEVQFNLVDTRVLRSAQKDPARYKDLMVRVWGFSAYFVDLPVEYQNHIIERSEHGIE